MDFNSLVKSYEFHVFGKKTTICFMTLNNGYEVVGQSACVNPDDFNKEMGEEFAYEDAMGQVGKMVGYMMHEYGGERQRIDLDANK